MGARLNLNGGSVPHKDMTEGQWREFVVNELTAGKRRFEELERGQRTMRGAIAENTRITLSTDKKVDEYILEARELGERRHKENGRKMDAAVMNATQAKESADAMVQKLDGVVQIWERGKMVKGFAVGLKTMLLGTATALASVSIIVAAILYLLGRGQMPPFPH